MMYTIKIKGREVGTKTPFNVDLEVSSPDKNSTERQDTVILGINLQGIQSRVEYKIDDLINLGKMLESLK